jgi:hypothetical protein
MRDTIDLPLLQECRRWQIDKLVPSSFHKTLSIKQIKLICDELPSQKRSNLPKYLMRQHFLLTFVGVRALLISS